MNKTQQEYIARVLINAVDLLGEDMWLPKIYVVNGRPCWFLNAARRAAYGTNHPIEMMTIEQAYQIHFGRPWPMENRNQVVWGFDQTGETYDGFLFERDNVTRASKHKSDDPLPEEIEGDARLYERNLIESVFNRCEGNKTMTAAQLGISVYTLSKKLKEYGIKSPIVEKVK